jgi:FkbM family methyltransferase
VIELNNQKSDFGATGKCLIANTVYGQMVVFERDEIIGKALLDSGRFQEDSITNVKRFIETTYSKRLKIFVDIGANIGTHLVFAIKCLNFDRGIAFELDPDNYRLLKINTIINNIEDRVSLHNVAITSSSVEVDVGLSDSNFGDHRITSNFVASDSNINFERPRKRRLKVQGISIDDYFSADKLIDSCDCLFWIDTQGHEGHVFDGGKFTYSSTKKNKFIVAEFWPYGLEISGGKYSFFSLAKKALYIYDINSSGLTNATPIKLDLVYEMYDEMLKNTRDGYFPHTDLLFVI